MDKLQIPKQTRNNSDTSFTLERIHIDIQICFNSYCSYQSENKILFPRNRKLLSRFELLHLLLAFDETLRLQTNAQC